MDEKIKDALKYLETGGLGEVYGLTDMAWQMGQPKVQSDTDIVMALCVLAQEAIQIRQHPSFKAKYSNR